MYCPECGNAVSGKFCEKCGRELKANQGTPTPVVEFRQTRAVYATAPGAPTSGMAISALVLSFFIPIVGIILGFIARGEIKNSQGQKSGDNLANLAIFLGFIFSAFYILYFIMFVGFFSSY